MYKEWSILLLLCIILSLYIKYRLCLSKYNSLKQKIDKDLDMSLNLFTQYNYLKEKNTICNKSFKLIEPYIDVDIDYIFEGRQNLDSIKNNYPETCKKACLNSINNCHSNHTNKKATSL